MTATILAFPTAAERDDLEFAHTGSSPLTRICDEISSLDLAARLSSERPTMPARIAILARAIERLASYRPDDAQALVPVGSAWVSISAAPAILSAMMKLPKSAVQRGVAP